MKQRVLFAGRARYRLPLDEAQRRKWDAVGEELDFRVLASSAGRSRGDERFLLLPSFGTNLVDGPLFYASLPFRIASQLRTFRPAAVICQSPYETAAALIARAVTRSRVAVIAEVHGDWRTATRMYGSRARSAARPLADAVAVGALRRADAVRTLSRFTSDVAREAGVEPAATFPTWTDLGAFVSAEPAPLPAEPRVAFVGVLQPYKNIDGLAATWRMVAERVPEAVLHVIGRGPDAPTVEALLRDLPHNVEWSQALPATGVAAALDAAAVFFLPSRREGLGRVVIEALARGRPVVASSTGGIPDLVTPGVNGLLFDPDDHAGMAGALVDLLTHRDALEQLARGTRPSVEEWLWTPDEYARRVAELVDGAVSLR